MFSKAFETAVLASLETGMVGNSRKVDIDAEGIAIKDADSSALRLSKELLRSPKLKDIRRVRRELKAYIRARCVPGNYFREGCWLIKRELVTDVHATYLAAKAKLRELVDDFLATEYQARIDESRERLGALWNPADYPTAAEFRAACHIKLTLVELQSPEGLPADVQAEQAAEAEIAWKNQLQEITLALRESFQGVLAHLVDRLQPGEDGKPKVIKAGTFSKMQEFLAFFEHKNMGDDAALAEMVAKARGVLDGVDAAQLRGNADAIANMAQTLGGVKAAVDGMVTEQRGRMFAFDE